MASPLAVSMPDTSTQPFSYWLLAAVFALTGSLILFVPPLMGWHDWQRLGQLILIACAAIFLVGSRAGMPLSRQSSWILSAIAMLGILSCLQAHQPIWAFTELALMTGCLLLLWASATARQRGGMALDKLLISAVSIICLLKILQFTVAYATATYLGDPLDPLMILDGFHNARFYGQFQTLTLPLLAAPLLVLSRRQAIPAFLLLCLWWTLTIACGTRGTWLGMGAAMALFCFVGQNGRRWAGWQLAAAITGCVFCIVLFSIIPSYMGESVENHPATRLTTSLSTREVLWAQALDMIRQSPWLGAGPMHFADTFNNNAAHPHQAVLQWASEWGIPVVLCLAWLFIKAACASFPVLRQPPAQDSKLVTGLRVSLAASVCASLTQAMVDGVFVMPNTQLWLSILGGWLLALHPGLSLAPQQRVVQIWRYAGLAAAGLLLAVSIRDVPQLSEQKAQFQKTFVADPMPRFWAQGVIAKGPAKSGIQPAPKP